MYVYKGNFVETAPLTINQWLITIGLGAISLPIGVLMRFIPVKEDPDTFFDSTLIKASDRDEKDHYSVISVNDGNK